MVDHNAHHNDDQLCRKDIATIGICHTVGGYLVRLSNPLHTSKVGCRGQDVGVALYFAYASAWEVPENARCFETWLVVAPRPPANFAAEAFAE